MIFWTIYKVLTHSEKIPKEIMPIVEKHTVYVMELNSTNGDFVAV